MTQLVQGDLSFLFPSGIKGIIFDCDGVMIDSENANRAFYNIILASLGLPPMSREQEEFAFMATARKALQHMIPARYHEKLDNIIRENVDYKRDVLPKITLMPGFRNFIEKCSEYGLNLAIDTNRTDLGIAAILDRFDLKSIFSPVISCSECEPKPSSQGVKKICSNWNFDPERVLMVGDSFTDWQAARGASVKFAAFANQELSADLYMADYRSFSDFLFPFLELKK